MFETRLRPPQLRTDGATDDGRHATWLELCFDLVFAAVEVPDLLVGDLRTFFGELR